MLMRIGLALIVVALTAGCLCAAAPVGLRVALPPSPTPTPFVSSFEASGAFYVMPTPTPLSVAAMAKQEGEAEIGDTRVRLEEPVMLTFKNGSTARGVLRAVADGVVQITQGEAVLSFNIEDVASATQF